MKEKNAPLERLKHHVTGAIERGEKVAIVGKPAMKENKHTPGPWEVSVTPNPQGETIFDVCVANGGDMIADLKDTDNAEANAQLIASAPELLEALECIQRITQTTVDLVSGGMMDAKEPDRHLIRLNELARQAIAKAKGGV